MPITRREIQKMLDDGAKCATLKDVGMMPLLVAGRHLPRGWHASDEMREKAHLSQGRLAEFELVSNENDLDPEWDESFISVAKTDKNGARPVRDNRQRKKSKEG